MVIYVKVDVRTWSRIVSCFLLSEIPRLIQYRYLSVNCVWWNTTFAETPPFSPHEFRTFQRRNNRGNHPFGIFKILFLHSLNNVIGIVRQRRTARHGFEQSHVFQNDQTHLENRQQIFFSTQMDDSPYRLHSDTAICLYNNGINGRKMLSLSKNGWNVGLWTLKGKTLSWLLFIVLLQ